MEVPVAGAGGPGGIPNKPQALLLIVAALAGFLCLFSSSSGQFPSASGLFSSTGFGLTLAMTGGLAGTTSSRMGAAGDDGDEGAAKGGVQPSGPLQEIWVSVQNMLGMAPPPKVEMDDSSSSSGESGRPATANRPSASGVKPQQQQGSTSEEKQDYKKPAPQPPVATDRAGTGNEEVSRSPHSPTVAMTPPQGYDDGGDRGSGDHTEHKHTLRNMFHRKKDGERKHHFRGMFGHKDQQGVDDD